MGQTTAMIVPGSLNTTLASTALGADEARDLLNCDTGRGLWELDLRHRRFAAAPVLTDEGEAGSGSAIFGGTGSEAARTGATISWSDPAAVAIGGDSSEALLPVNTKALWLEARGLLPTPVIPDDAEPSALSAIVRHKGDMGFARLAVIEIYVREDLRAILYPDAVVPTTMGDYVIVLSIGTIGVTTEELNAGDVAARVGYNAALSTDPAFNPDNWSAFTYTPVGETLIDDNPPSPWAGSMPWGGIGPIGDSSRYHETSSEGDCLVSATWIGAGPPPAHTVFSITTTLSGGDLEHGHTAQGATDSGSGSGTMVTTKKYVVAVDPGTGVAVKTIHMKATGSGGIEEIPGGPG